MPHIGFFVSTRQWKPWASSSSPPRITHCWIFFSYFFFTPRSCASGHMLIDYYIRCITCDMLWKYDFIWRKIFYYIFLEEAQNIHFVHLADCLLSRILRKLNMYVVKANIKFIWTTLVVFPHYIIANFLWFMIFNS